ncbi:MAG: dihydrolipoyl dehydrogenase [Blastochloris viridis]|uniref:Dihydrolipoyl dehydrogenase n=1 Tax=Blastochloris viridis TaxID=1079 RepID=A0A6N4RBC1_BLAVI|nr:MAG: dihydrolipoyl dehydrogenase [Blastochloris viridis]
MAEQFDVVVIGAGPAGYVCAIRAAQLGMKVCLVEKHSALGGTCLNVGCIPSKAMLESSHRYHMIQHSIHEHGIDVSGVKLNLAAMIGRKDAVVKQLTGGIGMLMKKNKVTVKNAWGSVKSAGVVALDNGEELAAKNIIVAAGSVPVELPFAKFDHKTIIDSTDALSLDKVPEHLIVIGAGVIGLEMGSVWQRLGARVTVIDIADRPIAVMDADLGIEAKKLFEKQGLEFVLQAKVKEVGSAGKVTVELADGTVKEFKGDKVLVAVGRRAATQGMNLAEAGVKMTERGVIEIDSHFQTSVPGIYAIGDCVPGPMLAHKGEEEGVAVAEHLAGQKAHVNYGVIPSVVYTHPEMAGVGLTEVEATEKYGDVKVGKFKFVANGRALAVDESGGFVKVIAHKQTDEILGVHMIGHNVSELIAEAVVLMEFKASAEDLARCVHAHPTMAEAFKEAGLAVDGRAIHA